MVFVPFQNTDMVKERERTAGRPKSDRKFDHRRRRNAFGGLIVPGLSSDHVVLQPQVQYG